jgi:hypothetical protein
VAVVKKLVLALLLAVGALAYAAPREREILKERPSGFWTSNRPAVGGAYRWRLLGLGVLIATGTGFLIVRTIRRANAERSQRPR